MPDSVAVALEGPGPRVLGLTAHERNRRVLERAGITVVNGHPGPRTPLQGTLTIPATVVITPALIPHLRNGAGFGPRLAASDRGLPAGSVHDVSTPAARREAIRALLQATGKPTDGWVARRLNRPLSRPLSRLLLAMRLTPAHASLLSLSTGLAAAVFAAHPSWPALVAAAVLFQAASVVDGVDGEMARLTHAESARGASMDTAVDIGTYLACCTAFGIGWARQGIESWELRLAGLVTFGLVVAFWQAGVFVRRYAPDASYVFIDRCVEHAAREQGGWGLRSLRVAFLLMRRDAFSLAFLVLAFTGQRVVYFVGLGAFVLLALLTFWLGRDSLAAAGAELNAASAAMNGHLQPVPVTTAAGPSRPVERPALQRSVVAGASRKALTRLDLDSHV